MTSQRPAFSQMIEDARQRLFDVLLVWKLDRQPYHIGSVLGSAWASDCLDFWLIKTDAKGDAPSTP